MYQKKQTHFVSEIDQFLMAYDRKHPELSSSQKAMKQKFQRICYLRDVADRTEPKKPQKNIIDDWF